MSETYKARYREGKRFRYGLACMSATVTSDNGEVWISVHHQYTNEAALLPAWQVEYEGRGPRGGRKWLPVTEFLDALPVPDEGSPLATEAVQLGLFGKEAA